MPNTKLPKKINHLFQHAAVSTQQINSPIHLSDP